MVQVLSIGIAVHDEIFALPGALVPGEKHRARALTAVAGGNAVNAALAIARLGGTASLIVRLGDDAAGAALRQRLDDHGIDTSMSRVAPGTVTSRSSIAIEPDGNRTIVNFLDPALPDRPDWLPTALPENARAVLGDTRWETGARHLFALARIRGIPAVFDGDRVPADIALLDLATHVAFSAQGLRELAGLRDLAAALRQVARDRTNFLAVTDGDHGVYAIMAGSVRHFPAMPIMAVDTLAAGDVWHGAFALALGEGRPEAAAIHFASAAAAIKCTRPGGSSGAPTRAETLAFLSHHSIDLEQMA